MRIWLLKSGGPLSIDGENVRLLRMCMIAKELSKNGHQVVLWAPTLNNCKKIFRSTSDKDIDISPNYTIKLLHSSGYKKNISFQRILHNRTIAKKFLQAAQKEGTPDIILAALPTIEFALAATKYGKQNDIPVVLDLRDMWPDIMLNVVPKILRPLARLALNWQFKGVQIACKNATALAGITPAFLQWGLCYAKRKQGQFDAVYPLAYSKEKPDEESIKEAELFWEKQGIKLCDNFFIISFVGSLNSSIELDIVIEAVKKMSNDVKLIIGGLGLRLNNYRKQASGNDNILLPSWLDKPKIWVLLKMSSIGISPYVRRKDFLMSVPNKSAECLSFGLPIVTSLSGGVLGDLLEKHKCGFSYHSDSVDDLAVILSRIKNDAILREEMSKNARALYEREFVAEKVYGDMCNHLEKIVNSHRN